MARSTGPKQKLQRKIGEDLGLKTNAVKTAKRLMVRPGQHGTKMRRKLSGFGIQLKEKQKLKHIYGLMEKQLRKLYQKASSDPFNTGAVLLSLLERRLDNVIYRLGFAPTRSSARQLVVHNHVLVNEKKMNVPSYLVNLHDVVQLKAKTLKIPMVVERMKSENQQTPAWLEKKASVAKIKRLPERDDVTEKIDEQLVIEFYSR